MARRRDETADEVENHIAEPKHESDNQERTEERKSTATFSAGVPNKALHAIKGATEHFEELR